MSPKQKPEDSVWDDITVVIVTFNSATVIESCLRPLLAANIVIVDNGSWDNTCDVVRQVSPKIKIIQNTKNIGFGAAMNIGLSHVTTPYGYAINPDAITQPGTMGVLVNKMITSPEAGIICPLIQDEHGAIDIPVMGPKEIFHHPMKDVPVGDFCTWFVTGAALLYRMSAWDRVGGYDENIFLYSEDVDLALRMSKAGYSMVVTPQVSVIHSGGGSSAPSPHVVMLKNWHMTWSHLYYKEKHLSRSLARREAWGKSVKFAINITLYLFSFRLKKAKREQTRLSACLCYLFKPVSIARQRGES